MSAIPRVLTIAGSDSSGGAGIQADVKTFTALNVYGASVITALTAQNTVGVQAIHVPPTSFTEQQLESVLSDIRFDAVKTGMLPTAGIIRVVASMVREYGIKTVVIDPVLVATSGDTLVEDQEVMVLKKELFPIATIITPNLPEAERLLARSISSPSELSSACRELAEPGCAVLLKGGHAVTGFEDSATDVMFDGTRMQAFSRPRLDTKNSHGTGCTLASAISAELAKGRTLEDSVKRAKDFVYAGLQDSLDIGKGKGPLNHMHALSGLGAAVP